MTKEEFEKFKFSANMVIDYTIPRTNERVECLLLAVNFETGVITVEVIGEKYENYVTHIHYDWCQKPYSVLKLLKK